MDSGASLNLSDVCGQFLYADDGPKEDVIKDKYGIV